MNKGQCRWRLYSFNSPDVYGPKGFSQFHWCSGLTNKKAKGLSSIQFHNQCDFSFLEHDDRPLSKSAQSFHLLKDCLFKNDQRCTSDPDCVGRIKETSQYLER
jgi:hypothetical protein